LKFSYPLKDLCSARGIQNKAYITSKWWHFQIYVDKDQTKEYLEKWNIYKLFRPTSRKAIRKFICSATGNYFWWDIETGQLPKHYREKEQLPKGKISSDFGKCFLKILSAYHYSIGKILGEKAHGELGRSDIPESRSLFTPQVKFIQVMW